MNADAKNILEQALKLTPEQKLELIGQIMESLEARPAIQLSQSQIAELERRRRLYEADPSRAIPWEQAKVEIREEVERRKKALGHRADAS